MQTRYGGPFLEVCFHLVQSGQRSIRSCRGLWRPRAQCLHRHSAVCCWHDIYMDPPPLAPVTIATPFAFDIVACACCQAKAQMSSGSWQTDYRQIAAKRQFSVSRTRSQHKPCHNDFFTASAHYSLPTAARDVKASDTDMRRSGLGGLDSKK